MNEDLNANGTPNYPLLAGPLITPEKSDQIAAALSFAGGPEDAGPDYGQFEETQQNAPPPQGGEAATADVQETAPVDYFAEREKGEKRKETWKSPDNGNTSNAIGVPDTSVSGVTGAILLRGRNKHRYEIIISNTGTNPLTIGTTARAAIGNGFTIGAGTAISLRSRAAWYAYAPSNATTTVDVLELGFDV